jgi:UDP-N-acetylglucosamine:LPS N-acetylglucosamine transferase
MSAGQTRILILSADIGEGHDLPARLLAEQIRRSRPETSVAVADSLKAAGRVVHRIVRGGAERTFVRSPRAFDLTYFAVTRVAPIRWSASRAACRLAGPGLARVIAMAAPDVIVSTYPGVNEVLGRMRRRSELDVPLVSAITDLAALRFWAHPAFDLHLIIHAESAPEVRDRAGRSTRIEHVRGLTDPQFLEPRDRADARRELGLPEAGRIVLVSGGGWGVGDIEGATHVALATATDAVVVLCGRNGALRARIDAAFAGEERVRAVGFTNRMGDWLAAADVLVHSTAGLTVLEAQIRGTRVISYGWGAGHIRANNRAYRELGLADVASTQAELGRALSAALGRPREPDLSLALLPEAADLVLELASAD